MTKKVLLLLALLLPLMAAAQTTFRFASRDTCDLYLDVYHPAPGSDSLFQGKKKPTVLFVFGGGFVTGGRNSEWHNGWLERLSREGYGAVAIDYRLGMKGYQVGKGLKGTLDASEAFYRAQQMGVEDVFSAVKFLAENQEMTGIDAGNLVISGSSAGAIISLAAIYDIANGRTEGLPEGFRFKGAMSFAGAIISNSGAPEFTAPPCPVLMLHGTEDKAVAYKKFGAFGKGIWGSDFLAKQFQKKGYPYIFYRFKDRTHDVASYMEACWPEERVFLEEEVMLEHRGTMDALVDDPSLPNWGDISLDDIYKK